VNSEEKKKKLMTEKKKKKNKNTRVWGFIRPKKESKASSSQKLCGDAISSKRYRGEPKRKRTKTSRASWKVA